jgi:hypothetical protein
MSANSEATSPPGATEALASPGAPEAPAAPSPPSFIKLAMRNMVRKGRQSLLHFGLTALGLTSFLVLIAWLGRPQLPG